MADALSQDGLEDEFFRSDRSRLKFHGRLFLLGLICPGAPYYLRGRKGRGVFVNLVLASLWLVFLLVWSVVKFAPTIPLVAFTGFWAILVGMAAFDGSRMREREARRMRERSSQIGQLITLNVTTWVGPLLGVFLLTLSMFWTVHRIDGQSMYPTLLSGDLVLIDKRAYDLRGPAPGDVIAYRRDGEIRFGRILAGPGESVSWLDGSWFVDGNRHMQAPLSGDSTSQFAEAAGSDPAVVDARWEYNGQLAYVVAGVPAGLATGSENPREWTVAENELFVLHDNRSNQSDSRVENGVRVGELEGMVLYILDSSTNEGRLSRVRAGKRVQMPNLLIPTQAARR